MKGEIEANVIDNIIQDLRRLNTKEKTIKKITKKLVKEFKLKSYKK